jgi:hypothetical protein
MTIPDYIVHYNRSEPFRSMTAVEPSFRSQTVKNLNETNSWGIARFLDAEYLDRRSMAEKRMHSEFVSRGGSPEIENPFYFFLGRNQQFESNELNKGYQILLKDLDPLSVSFTYGDSLLAYDENYRSQVGEKYKNPLCARLFLIEELENLFSHPAFPVSNRLHIEAQLWTRPDRKNVVNLC